MTAIASHVTAFFQKRLTLERHASVNTCDSYAYAFKMLLDYASKRLRTPPSSSNWNRSMHRWWSAS